MPRRRMRSGCIDPHFLDLGTRGEWSVSRPAALTPEKDTPNTSWIRGWVDPRAGPDDVENRKFFYPTGTRTMAPRSSSSQLVAIPTTLSRLVTEYVANYFHGTN
jgi:hypothetical protein